MIKRTAVGSGKVLTESVKASILVLMLSSSRLLLLGSFC